MLKLTLITLATLAALPSFAEASALPKPLRDLVQSRLKSSVRTERRLEAQSCANFAGHWTGTCHVADKEVKGSFAITQKGCESISFDGDSINLGHSVMESDSSAFANVAILSNARFSLDGQAAEAVATVNADSPYFPGTITLHLAGSMSRDADVLRLRGRVDAWVGADVSDGVPATCDFTLDR